MRSIVLLHLLLSVTQSVYNQEKPRVDCDYSVERYGPDIDNGNVTSELDLIAHCSHKLIFHIIEPAIGKAILLRVESVDIPTTGYLTIHQYHLPEESQNGVFVASVTNNGTNRQFVSGVSSGYYIVFDAHPLGQKGFNMQFERVDPENHTTCGNTQLVIGEEEIVVQEQISFPYVSGCAYELIRNETLRDEEWGDTYLEMTEGINNLVRIANKRSILDEPEENFQLYRNERTLILPKNITVGGRRFHILSIFESAALGPNQFCKIKAKVMRKTCACEGAKMRFLTHEMNQVVIRSPLFPYENCPDTTCNYIIDNDGLSIEGEKNVYLIETDIETAIGDKLHINSGEKRVFTHNLYRDGSQVSPNVMMIDEAKLRLFYQSGKTNSSRRFEVKITRLSIPHECQCSKFGEKNYDKSGSISITIPKNCSFIYCHWKITDAVVLKKVQNGRKLLFQKFDRVMDSHVRVEISMKNATFGDYVEVHAGPQHERYNADLLKDPIVVGTLKPFVYIAYSRPNIKASTDSVFQMSWTFANINECHRDNHNVLKSGEEVSSETPGWPTVYGNSLNCEYHYTAPENHNLKVKIENMDTDNLHDYLRIFDGEDLDSPQIANLTGIHKEEIYSSTDEYLTITFTSDQSVQRKGAKWTVTAVEVREKVLREREIGQTISCIIFASLFIFVLIFLYRKGILKGCRRARVELSIRQSDLEPPEEILVEAQEDGGTLMHI